MATALTVYFTNTASTDVTTASALATVSGGAQVGVDTAIGTATGYVEFYTLGQVTVLTLGSLPASPSGHEMLLDSNLLYNQAIGAGNWTITCRGNTHNANGNVTADIIFRFWVLHSGGSATKIGDITLAAQTITGTSTTYSFPATSLPEMDFGNGDMLAIGWYFNITANANTASNATLRFNTSTNLSGGGNANAQIVTPGYYALTTVAVSDSGAGGDTPTAQETAVSLNDAGAGSEAISFAPIAVSISDSGAGGDGADLNGRPPLSQPYSLAGVPTGGPYVVASNGMFAQNGRILPRMYGSTFYPATEGGTAIWQGTGATAWIDGVISTYVTYGLKVLRPTDQWGGNAGLTWDNPNIWQNMDYLVQQAALNGLYVQMDLSGWKAVLTARNQYAFAPDLWTGFLTEVGNHYASVNNILFYTIAGEPTFPRTQADVNELVTFFTQTIATLKAADPHHLCSPGGFINMNNGLSGWWQQIWQISSVDVCCYKSYSSNDLSNVSTYSSYAVQTLNKIAVNQEFGMPQFIGDGVWSGQTNNGISTSRASYFDSIMANGEASGTSVFIFWNYDHQSESAPRSPDFPAIADAAKGSEGVAIAINNTASITINDAGQGVDTMTGATSSFDVDPISSPAVWAVILAHIASVLSVNDAAAAMEALGIAVTSPEADSATGTEGLTRIPITYAVAALFLGPGASAGFSGPGGQMAIQLGPGGAATFLGE